MKIAAGPEDEAIALMEAPAAAVTMNDEVAVQALEGAALTEVAVNTQQDAYGQHNE